MHVTISFHHNIGAGQAVFYYIVIDTFIGIAEVYSSIPTIGYGGFELQVSPAIINN